MPDPKISERLFVILWSMCPLLLTEIKIGVQKYLCLASVSVYNTGKAFLFILCLFF